MSRLIDIQIQGIGAPSALSRIDTLLHVIHAVAGSARGSVAVRVNAARDYCNLSIDATRPGIIWRELLAAINQNAAMRSWLSHRWIVVLQGRLGWNDYLLLAHFNPTVRVDSLR
ncbi:hypothetical protein [Ramlibacter albus]|uniref:Uncharacterized protein n=1 Tax=Ramlibacter albus TaxID=2079448 RepID=A0A923MFF7_9BURK|nr:hypothetical protein [Ramlibacter albus]MBC5768611.1 hypothetical protein [Ramlibacter albus]